MSPFRKFSCYYFLRGITSTLVTLVSFSTQAIDGVSPYPAVVPLSSLNGSTTGFRMDGIQAAQESGTSVAGIGDFMNHDGISDISIGAWRTKPIGSSSQVGAVYVVSGRMLNSPFSSSFGLGGTLTFVGGTDERVGFAVSRAGDINDDGIEDLVIGAGQGVGSPQGTVYVVFGRETWLSTTLSLPALNGSDGFRIQGPVAYDQLGLSVSAAGDINGDGIDDLLIGAPAEQLVNASGSVYAIFGHATGVPLNQPFPAQVAVTQFNGQSVAKLQNGGGYVNGFRIDGVGLQDNFGVSVGTAGKFNDDSYDDIIVGAWKNDGNGTDSGAAYVILGRALPIPNNGVMQIGNVNTSGVVTLLGATAGVNTGIFVAGGGNLNGDERDDVAIASDNGIYVIYGQVNLPQTLNMGLITQNQGYLIDNNGIITRDELSLLKDINDDGVDDLLIGRWSYQGIGNSYVLFGRKTAPVANILALLDGLKGIRGYRLQGVAAADGSGYSVAAAGDVNADGLNDLMVGAPSADPGGQIDAGSSYVVFGNNDRVFASGLEANE